MVSTMWKATWPPTEPALPVGLLPLQAVLDLLEQRQHPFAARALCEAIAQTADMVKSSPRRAWLLRSGRAHRRSPVLRAGEVVRVKHPQLVASQTRCEEFAGCRRFWFRWFYLF